MDRDRDRADRRAVERLLPGQCLERDDAERPDVGPLVDLRRAHALLRAHVIRRAHDLTGHRRARAPLRLPPGSAEVEELDEDLTAFGLRIAEEDVLGLDVAMDDRGLVGLRERLSDLADDRDDVDRGHAHVLDEMSAEVLALEQLHHDVRRSAVGHAVVEDLDDVRALGRRAYRRLTCEALRAIGPLRHLRRHQLHDDLRVEPLVLGDPHPAHSALGQRPNEPHGRSHEVARL